MAFLQNAISPLQKASATTSPSALYGLGGNTTIAKNATTAPAYKIPQMPGFTQPNLGLGGKSPYTNPNPTTPYQPGVWNSAAGGVPATGDPQAAINQYLRNDPIRVGQITALNEQLRSRWATDVLSKARNAELFFGAAPRDPTGNALNLSQFGSTGPLGFVLGGDLGEQAPPLGDSLAATLLDSTLLSQAAGNRFSVINEIGRQLAGRNAAALASTHGGGAYEQLKAEHGLGAERAIQEGANQFLSVLNDLYSGWLGNLESAQGQYTGYGTDSFNRMMQLIANNVIDPFGTRRPPEPPPPAPPPEEPPPAPPPPFDYFEPPEYGPDRGYIPTGSPGGFQTLIAPDNAGIYRSGGGRVSYQSNTGNRKLLF